MAFCEHCQGQRFDRSRILRLLRELQRECRRGRGDAAREQVIADVIEEVRGLDIPHIEPEEDFGDMTVH